MTMDIFSRFPFISGQAPQVTPPLARFLPPVNAGIVSAWLNDHTPAGAWVLDPFAASPLIAVEAARAGRRVIVTANNPVARFLLEMTAAPPVFADFQAGMAELANSRKEGERLEVHLQNLYLTECANCRGSVIAQAFIWDRHSGILIGKIYTCPHCGDHGEREAIAADAERAAQWPATETLHRARALERVVARDDPEREHAEEALSNYWPRAVYALGTLINRLDGLTIPSERRRALIALMLSAFDQTNSLWPHPTERPRPRVLSIPNKFLENNVWQALEDGIALWTNESAPVPVTLWPELPPESGGVCIYEGPLRDLTAQLTEIKFSAALTAIPRPNQAYWTLCALWAGWLWGRDAVGPFKGVLRRRRYDWQWHAEALRSVFDNLFETLGAGAPFYALLAEAEPSFVTAALAAAQAAGFDLNGIAMRTIHDPLQIEWLRGEKKKEAPISGRPIVRAALEVYLGERGEPAAYFSLHAAGVAALAGQHALIWSGDLLAKTEETIQAVIDAPPFKRWEARNTVESGFWGLIEAPRDVTPLVDRVEKAVVTFLLKNHGCTVDAIEAEVNRQFPGMMTPPLGLIRAILESYGLEEKGWWIRTEDFPSTRRNDLAEMKRLIEKIGARLEYAVHQPDSNLVLWGDPQKPDYAFYLIVSAVMGKSFWENPHPAEKSILVLPGGRAGLLAYKLRRDPALKNRAQGWRFLKFRQLRLLEDIPLLTRETWKDQLSLDPIEQGEDGQMMMF
jgi:hypothetical protein